ncbi:putative ribonuclease H-like domain-containing protein [Tanacetum coccineum]
MDVKSAFLYGTIQEEVYVTQPPRFKDPDYPNKVYKVVKALYGLHQAPRAWYETLANYLMGNGFKRGKIDQTLFIKKQKGDSWLMSSMGELTFFLGLQVQQKEDGIFISQDKYVAEILKKFNYTDVKSASTPVDLKKPLVKDKDADDVDCTFYYYDWVCEVSHCYWLVAYTDSDYDGATQDKKSTTGGNYYCQAKVGDEVVHKELGDRMERAATTASSLEAEQDSGSGLRCQDTILGDVDAQTRFETTSKQSNDPPLSKGYTLRSGEDSMKLLELKRACEKKQLMLEVLFGKKLKLVLIRYALTFNPTIYTSCIKQFWSTAKAKMVNSECQIQDLIDKNEELARMRFLDLEKAKDAQAKEIAALKKRVQKLERKKKSRTTELQRLRKVGESSRVESSEDKESLGDHEDASKQGRSIEDIDKDADVSFFDITRGGQDDD